MKQTVKKILEKTRTLGLYRKTKYYLKHYDPRPSIAFPWKKTPEKDSYKVSIIIPSYKNVRFLNESVKTALKQTYPNKEIIVMTDVPEEGAKEALSEYLDRIRLFTEPNLHLCEKFNAMIDRASGDAIVFLSEDDLLDKKFLEKTVYALKKYETDIVYTDMKLFGETTAYYPAGTWAKESFYETTPAFITALFKKDVWKKVGGYSKSVYFDWDFWWSAFEKGARAHHIKQPLFLYRTHGGQETKRIDKQQEDRAKFEVQNKHNGTVQGK